MNQWLFNKILSYLKEKEGFDSIPDDKEINGDSVTTIVQDTFGFRYKVTVKTLGRNYAAGFGEISTGSYMRTDDFNT